MTRSYNKLLPSNMYQSYATGYTYRAITSGFIDSTDLIAVKGATIKSICGTSFKFTGQTEDFDNLTQHLQQRLTVTKGCDLGHNCRVFEHGLQLPANSWKVIKLMAVLKVNGGLYEWIHCCLPSDIHINSMFSHMVGITEEALININLALVETGLVRGSQYLQLDQSGIPHALVEKLVGEKVTSYTELIEPLVQIQPPSTLGLSDFEHLELEDLIAFLDIALNHSIQGVNLLLWGEPGTGKSTLCRLLADTLGASLIAIKALGDNVQQREVDYEQEKLSSNLRLQHHQLIQRIVSHDEKSLLMLDEAEDILVQQVFNHRASGGKDNLHAMLEANTVPCIWVVNSVEDIPASVLRRFNFVKHVFVPDNRVMEGIIAKTTKGLRLSKPFKAQLATKDNVTPANIANAAFVCHTIGHQGKQAEALVDSLITEVHQACGFKTTTATYKPQMAFSLDNLNIKGGNKALVDIERAMKQHSGVRALFTGPSGTGKSALANHLAKTTNQELITIRCSDVLDKYVGGSEKNIANLFANATEQGAALFIDEVDSLLADRSGASQNFEIQQVNELLTQIDCFELPLFAATNFDKHLDRAVMRRFDFKLAFEYLTSEQLKRLFREACGRSQITDSQLQQLANLKNIAVGDFAIIKRRQQLSTTKLSAQDCLDILITESNHKQTTRPIGFVK
ncbi:ATP-binding protein [Pseudoalteromonas sp. CnMc7-15]|uniref:AAA family ATPase n=1 Tax=unclassified Pseudoalteromonas TaxID=194690 RepID=UPI001EF5DC8F|nr:ATP-binding protein [Pseudoalteromonas sp. CnMc7-15]MCG7566614.1 ATP-binding protein [Pseudoalteromonas sp. CnMc7-15]